MRFDFQRNRNSIEFYTQVKIILNLYQIIEASEKLRLQNIFINTNISVIPCFMIQSIGWNSIEIYNDKLFQIPLFSLDRAENRLRTLKGDELFPNIQTLTHIHDVINPWLMIRYFHEEISVDLHSLDSPRITFTSCHIHWSKSHTFPRYSIGGK